MDSVVYLIRILTAVIAPTGAVVMAILTVFKVRNSKGTLSEVGDPCLRCGNLGKGAEGQFWYSTNNGNANDRSHRLKLTLGNTRILGSESCFICDQCALRVIRNEIFQLFLMVVPYPLYLYVIVPQFAEDGVFANFLIETLLIVLSVGGLTAILDLFRVVCLGESPLAEARDRVAIQVRKNVLGKRFKYFTRISSSHFEK